VAERPEDDPHPEGDDLAHQARRILALASAPEEPAQNHRRGGEKE